MMTAFWIFAGFSFVFGAIIGSFLNVVIYRYPRGESIVFPSSRCPDCTTTLAWYDNIPIVSWLLLGGRCRHCDARISGRYVSIEAFTATASTALWWKVAAVPFAEASSPSSLSLAAIVVPYLAYFVFVAVLIVVAFVDLDHYIVPHAFTAPGIVLGLATPWLVSWLVPRGALGHFWPPVTWTDSLVGFAAGALSVLVLYFGYLSVRGIEGLGGGDVTLMALVGAWLGWPALLFVFFAASLQGLLAALASRLAGSDWLRTSAEIFEETEPDDADAETERGADKLAVPFGPFIALAALEHLFLGAYLPTFISLRYLY